MWNRYGGTGEEIVSFKNILPLQTKSSFFAIDENRHSHTHHARTYAELGTEIRLWRIYTPGTPQLQSLHDER